MGLLCSGWSSRTQFEETWATLLGVLVTQPITKDQEEDTQQEVCTELEKDFTLKMLLVRKMQTSHVGMNSSICLYWRMQRSMYLYTNKYLDNYKHMIFNT